MMDVSVYEFKMIALSAYFALKADARRITPHRLITVRSLRLNNEASKVHLVFAWTLTYASRLAASVVLLWLPMDITVSVAGKVRAACSFINLECYNIPFNGQDRHPFS